MTAQLDQWAISDHDPTSQAEALQQLALMATQSPPPVDDIDELAVLQVAHDGLRLRLRGADRDEAVRRMYGRVEADLLAWRLFTTARTIFRVAARLGLTEQKPADTRQFGERRDPMAVMGCPPHAVTSRHRS
ncbi:hypothetical protein [Mycobacterium arosiense]|uniref:Uncharacterized protein n=1 Tax=Mycobacterium arosiense ATCC BAA-1401 = DSM 45069 TaxID=1265311 RepID=A0A1W9ZGG2_MYCAI|nr:hypothetical protein [Mycobacterium arosiense]ORA14861.1 hypothetical protein BST14_13300 [Mycobacterium arosiense ATCC BAA-1401 = DSM 45069]